MPADSRVVLDGRDLRRLGEIAADALRRELAYGEHHRIDLGPADYLAISGGGEAGAYGAGMLTAWSELGTRPVFKAVTGVSTGALIAPFAYLGSGYDEQLEHLYTDITEGDVMRSRGLLAAVWGDSLYDTAPLLHTIRTALKQDVVAAIAHEHTVKGRLLFVATTNLDLRTGVLWNIGAIAASGKPRAAELIARILLASASVPALYPPVMIDLVADGRHYQEMHVDGGAVAQVVFYPPSFSEADMFKPGASADARLLNILRRRSRRLFVIRNSRLGIDPETVDRSTFKIAERAVATLINAQGIGDLYQLYLVAQRDRIDFNVAYIAESFTEKSRTPFDQRYMRALYAFGRQTMLTGSPWSKFPPTYDPTPAISFGVGNSGGFPR